MWDNHFVHYTAQRLAAHPPGHFRFVVTILAVILKLHFSVRSLSLGQSAATVCWAGLSPF